VADLFEDNDNEKKILRQKNETLEKKVDSLVKFLENERRLRHELEDLVK
jgi:hypothetical protein